MCSQKYFRQELLEILSELKKISDRIAVLLPRLDDGDLSLKENGGRGLGLFSLLALPDHLRKSVIALSEFDETTAAEVAKKTSRTRVAESVYLNQLYRMGYINRNRRGRTVYFGLKGGKT
jgi:DNA-binding transcriptional ArsR family regulator